MDNIVFPAHINNDKVQSVEEHCINTAEYARKCVESVGLGNTAYLAGLLHDFGKYKKEFAEYITKSVSGEKGVRGTVNHTFAGVRYILAGISKDEDLYKSLTRELIAFAIGSHHGQFDIVNENGLNGFDHRLNDTTISYEESYKNYQALCSNQEEINSYLDNSTEEIKKITSLFSNILEDVNSDDIFNQEMMMLLSLLARMLLSAVIEGDRRDTAEFMSSMKFIKYNKKDIWEDALKNVESKLEQMPSATPIQIVRKDISKRCREFAQNKSGIYRLNIPTGAGKTLSSLRYALAHAKIYNKERIIFTSPLLGILDQNAKVIKDFVNNDEIILEHHSNVIKDDVSSEKSILEETWDSPIIITTLVQLLNTLFSGKTKSIRRFHSLCDSVIVIDEVQTVPIKMLSQFNLAMTFLSEICGATIVLCSATQPCFEETEHGIRAKIQDMIPYCEKEWRVFKRTNMQYKSNAVLSDIPVISDEILGKYNSLLIVCNKKSESEILFKELSKTYDKIFHLSAAMCMKHRQNTLESIYCALDESKRTGEKVICVSTQVIEAGVDISFSAVIRFAAGMDNAVQASGRCNRNGESELPLPVYIVNCQDENLEKLREIQYAKDATADLCNFFNYNPQLFGANLASDAAIKYYYNALYRRLPLKYQDYPLGEKCNGTSLFELLSENKTFRKDSCESKYQLVQAFKTAGDLFEVFDNETIDVVVPYEEGKNIILELNSDSARFDIMYQKKLLSKAKLYTVPLYNWQKEKLLKQGGLYTVCDNLIYVLSDEFYDEKLGLETEFGEKQYMEV